MRRTKQRNLQVLFLLLALFWIALFVLDITHYRRVTVTAWFIVIQLALCGFWIARLRRLDPT